MKKVRTMEEAYRVFDYLGIKDVTKDWQRKKGTEVWELPFKTMYYNGYSQVNRFTIYKNGYVRKMVVYGENNATQSCYQLNRVRKVAEFVKDYDYNDETCKFTWNGKYRKIHGNARIMIDNHRDRVVYLCNYILKNYYRSQTGAGFYRINDYQVNLMQEYCKDSHKLDKIEHPERYDLRKTFPSLAQVDDVQVIINGHRYKLS